MLRRLLACFALLSGLAALGTPAQAQFVETLEQLEISAQRGDKVRASMPTCDELQEAQRHRGEKPAPCPEERAVRIYIPSVMFGADRAFE